jgi:hypothetical protein
MPRITSFIELSEYEALLSSAFYSKEIGCPLDTHITIELERLGCSLTEYQQEWRRIRQRIRWFHGKNKVPYGCLWSFENSPSIGVHVHCLIHRGHLTNHGYRRAFLNAIGYPRASAEFIKINKHHANKSWETNTIYLVEYLCKGIREEHRHVLSRQDCTAQGEIMGKRVGWTRNLKPLY